MKLFTLVYGVPFSGHLAGIVSVGSGALKSGIISNSGCAIATLHLY